MIHSWTGKAPFEIVEGAIKVPPFLSMKDKIFEADKYTRDLDTAFAKVRETSQKSQERQKKAADRHRRDLKLKENDWVFLRFEKARLRKKKGKERIFLKLSICICPRAYKLEKFEARKTILPFIQAEEDARYIRDRQRWLEEEATIMANVPGWKAVIANGPFEKWGIDAMGPLPRTANGKLYILVAIDYMTRFGTPLEIVSDNGPGFRRGLLTEVCEELNISHRHSTPYYPQSNGLVEKANGIIAGIIRKMVESKPKRWDNFLDGAIWAYRTTYRDAIIPNGIIAGIIRKMVESKPKRWDNFLDGAIWAYRTTYRDATQFIPFHLVYGQEALQPIELNIPTIKLTGRQEQNNDEAWIDRLLNLVELEWKREAAYHCYEKKALQLKDKVNEGIKDKEIKEKSLVLRYNNALDNRFDAKFERRWEGPFIVKKAFTGGYYQLMDLNKEHPRKVNGYRLKPYLSRILPAVFETKQVSKKTKKVCCHCCSGTHQVKSRAFQHVLHEVAMNQKKKLSSPTSCPESSFQYDPVDGT
ncbi:hypothetical protein L7F22_058065 [Adiantum nelumboides]|nr:hypothetical protein [Adiantum nelumboides]